ncbi:MAG: hypothetical protein QOE22_129 [Candidatus Parcubacteria bacterium]|jgi:hypothetical protein|nr:hypothetical protein [Candidatus Parcubacteria bacterium]
MARTSRAAIAQTPTYEDIFSRLHNCSADPNFLALVVGGVHDSPDPRQVKYFDLDHNTPASEVLKGGARGQEAAWWPDMGFNNRILSIHTVAELMLAQEKGGDGPLTTSGCTNVLFLKVNGEIVMALLRWQRGTFSWHIKHKPTDEYHLLGSRTRVFYAP